MEESARFLVVPIRLAPRPSNRALPALSFALHKLYAHPITNNDPRPCSELFHSMGHLRAPWNAAFGLPGNERGTRPPRHSLYACPCIVSSAPPAVFLSGFHACSSVAALAGAFDVFIRRASSAWARRP